MKEKIIQYYILVKHFNFTLSEVESLKEYEREYLYKEVIKLI